MPEQMPEQNALGKFRYSMTRNQILQQLPILQDLESRRAEHDSDHIAEDQSTGTVTFGLLHLFSRPAVPSWLLRLQPFKTL